MWVGDAFQALKGSPFEVSIIPGVADPTHCLASIICSDSSERVTEAGAEFTVAQELRDRYDNITLLAGEGTSSGHELNTLIRSLAAQHQG